VRIPIVDLLIRLRTEAQARPEAASIRGGGAARTTKTSAIWRTWGAIYSKLGLYRITTWFMSRGRSLSPTEQGAWTRSRTPLVPAPKRLRDLLRERQS
jgi:L-lactate dehydrogenase complex protein LldF